MYQVLLVDDEPAVCEGLKRFFDWEAHGCQVALTAHSVAQALVALESRAVDIIICDIKMPVQSGIDLLHIVREECPYTKVVMLSGYSEFSYVQQALRLGASDYLTKPVDFSELSGLITRLRSELAAESERRRKERALSEWSGRLMLLKLIRGDTLGEDERAMLPPLFPYRPWRFILDCGADDALTRKNELTRQIQSACPEAIVVSNDVYELFAVLPETFETAPLIDQIIACADRTDTSVYAGRGMVFSRWEELADAFHQAGQAARYQRARQRKGIALYEQIRHVVAGGLKDENARIQLILNALITPNERPADQMSQALEEAVKDWQCSVHQLKLFCMRLLIEISNFLQTYGLNKLSSHLEFNEQLRRLISCEQSRQILDCMNEYFRLVASRMVSEDEAAFNMELISRVRLYIQEHYAEDLSLNTLAACFYVHPNYLSRAFKKKTGQNFLDYLTSVRMERAKDMLKHTDQKVYDIALSAGYDSPRYFSRLYKQAFGESPSEWRAARQKEKAEKQTGGDQVNGETDLSL